MQGGAIGAFGVACLASFQCSLDVAPRQHAKLLEPSFSSVVPGPLLCRPCSSVALHAMSIAPKTIEKIATYLKAIEQNERIVQSWESLMALLREEGLAEARWRPY